MLPSDRTIVLERFRDEIGDWRLCLLSPYGGRVHAAWALALSARIRERFDLEADVIWSDDGIVLHLPDLDAEEAEALPSAAELVLLEPEEVEQAITAELGGSALFGARFRENAARALLIPRAYPGRRTPLWQQRLKAQSLLEVASRYADFPIVLETYRECLRDVLDVAGLEELLRDLHTREISLVEVETPTASPFASSLLFDYVATYMYEGDTPNAERRAAALSLDRDLLRELLGQEELRELIDPGALERVEDDLQHRSELTRATGRDGLHDVLRRVGDLDARGGLASACSTASTPPRLLRRAGARTARDPPAHRRGGALRRRRRGRPLPRRAVRGSARRSAARRSSRMCPTRWRVLVARFARTHGPFTTEDLRGRYGVDASAVLRELERSGESRPRRAAAGRLRARLVRRRGSAAPAGARRWRPCARRSSPPTRRSLAAFLPSWQGVDRHSGAGAGHRPAARGAGGAAGPRAAGGDLGARRAPAPHRRLLPVVARQPLRERRARVGRGGLLGGALRARRPLLPR